MAEISSEYRILCRFFKEIKMYHYFLMYQREGNKHVNFHCKPIDTDTENCVAALGKTSITVFIEEKTRVIFKYKLYEVFKVWLTQNREKIGRGNVCYFNYQFDGIIKEVFNKDHCTINPQKMIYKKKTY